MAGRLRRIMVIGISGAGKSTFAARLAAAADLPLVHLDREHWLPGWREPDKAGWRRRVTELAAGPAWVMDGNYSGTFDIRMPRAQAIVWLDYPRVRSIGRVLRRALAHWGRTRPDMADSCPEHIDREFLLYIWRFPQRHRPLVQRALSTFGATAEVHRLTRDAEWASLIAALAAA